MIWQTSISIPGNIATSCGLTRRTLERSLPTGSKRRFREQFNFAGGAFAAVTPEPWMTSLLFNLISGLVGALIGAGISIYIYRRSQRDAAQQKLLAMVYRLGFESWYNPQEGKPGLIFHEHYNLLWSLYAELRQCILMPWNRKRLDKAWQKYMHMDNYYDEIPNSEFWKIFAKGTHTSKEEAVRASSEFVDFLRKI
jgi:hypothetical protein